MAQPDNQAEKLIGYPVTVAGYSVTFSVVDNAIDPATKQIDVINRRIAQTRAPLERLSKTVARFVDVSGLRTIANGFGMIARTALSAAKAIFSIIPGLGAITSAATIAGMVALVKNCRPSSIKPRARMPTVSA